MARIYTYPNDAKLQDDDAWIGTNKLDLATVQFTAQKIADYLNLDGKISVNSQINYKYEFGQLSAESTMTQETGPGNESFVNLSEINVHKYDITGQVVANFLNILVGSQILISEFNEINHFGHYELQSFVQNSTNPDFYTLTINEINSNGALINNNYYHISLLNLGTDKNYTHTQNSVSAVWTINHNLNKKPSVTVVDSGDSVVHGEILYTSLNSLTITFSGGFTGKAYLN